MRGNLHRRDDRHRAHGEIVNRRIFEIGAPVHIAWLRGEALQQRCQGSALSDR